MIAHLRGKLIFKQPGQAQPCLKHPERLAGNRLALAKQSAGYLRHIAKDRQKATTRMTVAVARARHGK